MTLALDRTASRVCQELHDHGIRSILLKGPATQRLVYGETFRPYCDVDLLVSPDDWSRAGSYLEQAEYRRAVSPAVGTVTAATYRHHDGTTVDLHRDLHMATMAPQTCWTVLASEAEPRLLSGGQVEMLSAPAQIAVLALHACQHGFAHAKPIADLTRAVEVLPLSLWQRAAGVADRLGATDAMVAGLELVVGGRELGERLGLRESHVFARVCAASGPSSGRLLAKFLSARSPSRRWALLRPMILPTNDELGQWAWAERMLRWPGGAVLVRPVWWGRAIVRLPTAGLWCLRHARRAPPQAGR